MIKISLLKLKYLIFIRSQKIKRKGGKFLLFSSKVLKNQDLTKIELPVLSRKLPYKSSFRLFIKPTKNPVTVFILSVTGFNLINSFLIPHE